jgi:hypothetical protein
MHVCPPDRFRQTGPLGESEYDFRWGSYVNLVIWADDHRLPAVTHDQYGSNRICAVLHGEEVPPLALQCAVAGKQSAFRSADCWQSRLNARPARETEPAGVTDPVTVYVEKVRMHAMPAVYCVD